MLQHLDRSRRRVWRVSDGSPAGMPATQRNQALRYLADAGLLERVERGVYLVLPRSGRILVSPLELVGSWFEGEPHAVVGHAAAEYHRLTLDTSEVVEVQLGRKKASAEFQGVRYVFSCVPMKRLLADNMRVEAGQAHTTVASPGKLLVQLLEKSPARRSARPTRDARLAVEVLEGGIRQNIWAKVDWPKLVRRHGNSSVARRLGFLLQRSGIAAAEGLLDLRGGAGYVAFSPAYPPAGPTDPRWRLILNDPMVQ